MSDSETLPASQGDRSAALRRIDVTVRSGRALGSQSGRPVVVVLGMHRSGTSLLSNVLHFLGVDMADTTDLVSPKNAGGFWERPELVAIHDEILAAVGRPIGRPGHLLPLPPAWWRRKDIQALKPKLVGFVRDQLAKSANPWGFKDPRTCRLLPLWWEVFRELDLKPIYVHAIRTPAEASVSMSQKSSVRKLSVASGELMWLSYNYDILRYVAAEHPIPTVDYEEWFADGSAVARRLIEALGIGQDLSAEDVDECVASIVQGEYRHQVAKPGGLTSGVPLATTLYEAMTPLTRSGGADPRMLRGQLPGIDLLLKSLAPITEELEAAADMHADLAERDERIAKLEERYALSEKAAASLGEAQLERQGRRSRALLAAAKRWREAFRREQEDAAKERRRAAELSSGLEARLQQAVAREQRLLREQAEAESALRREAHAQQEELRRSAAEREAELRRAAAERQNDLLREADAREESLRREAEAREAALRDQQAALRREQEAGLLHASETIAGLRVELDETLRRLALAEDRNRRFADAIGARDATIADQRRRIAARGGNGAEEAAQSFVWPAGTMPLATGGIDRVDDAGLAGHAAFPDRPDLLPVIEARVDGAMVLAIACSATSDISADAGGRFRIGWGSFAPDQAGRRVELRIAGTDQHLGETTIPDDLSRFHLPAAEFAALRLGGTVAEAADYHRWIAAHEPSDEASLARAFASAEAAEWPAILVLVHGSGRSAFEATLASLVGQVHGRWEAVCIGAPAELGDLDPRITIVGAEETAQTLDAIAADTLLSFVDAGDMLAPTALLHLAVAAREAPGFALIYSDEDLIDSASGVRGLPHMKGEWSADLALHQDYASRLALVRRGDRLGASIAPLDGAAVYRFVLDAALAPGAQVIHLPFVLYHRDVDNARSAPDLGPAVEAVLRDGPASLRDATLARTDAGWSIRWPLPDPAPRVSLVVPTRDRVDLLRVCVDGFLHETRYPDLEILIADNDSQEEETLAYLAQVSADPRVRVIPCPGPFNYSAINNAAAAHATGTLIGLMNNDLKVIDPDWLRRMAAHAVRPDIGIVGAKLLHGDDTIQHAGVTLGIGLASHLYKSFPPGAEGRNGRLVLPQDVSAVTAACLLMRRDVWDEVGGLDEEFPVAYNDIDLCLKVTAAGYRILWDPEVLVYHLESQSRGKDATPEKRERLDADKARMAARWGARLERDPFHSPNLANTHIDARLAFPARLTPPWRAQA